MAVTADLQAMCDAWLKLTLLGCEIHGNDPVVVLKTYRAVGHSDAPFNDLLMATIDRALFELEPPVTAS